ncbi:MAG: hypothetical protein B7733_07760 [Myxococcales bacterium FL481]|nr:MAG: hypothetical protein B7733_07760 [Myxococcales bacterium FL481]
MQAVACALAVGIAAAWLVRRVFRAPQATCGGCSGPARGPSLAPKTAVRSSQLRVLGSHGSGARTPVP